MASSKASSYTAPERPEDTHTVPERSEGSHTAPKRSEDSHTAPASSDKVYHNVCESCFEDGVDKEAKHYCQDCKQNICDTCKDYHKKLAVTRNHTITPVSKGLASANKQSGEKTVLLGRTVQSRSQVNVKAGDDKETPWITGCTVMANGDVVLCDRNNQNIKLLSGSGVLTGNLLLSSGPWDVSVLDSRSVIITLPNKQLQVVQVYPQLKPGRVIQLDKKCWGVAVVKDELYVTCHKDPGKGEIRVLGLDGKVKRLLGVNQDGSFMFTSPRYITVNQSGEKIVTSDWSTHTITCMSVDGGVIYAYKYNSFILPTALLCDSEDNILVCGWANNTVQVLTADGKRHSTLLTVGDGLNVPYSIAYRDSDNTLLVGCDYNNNLLSFQLSK